MQRMSASLAVGLNWPVSIELIVFRETPTSSASCDWERHFSQRLTEAARTGFKTCIIPRHGTANLTAPDGVELLRVRNIREAIELALA